MMRNILIITFLSLFLLMGCTEIDDSSKKPVIVTSIFPIADIIQNIAGDDYEVIYLIKPGQDPHTFEPTPDTVVKIQESKVIFTVGFGFEFWLEKLLKSNSRVIDLSKRITPIDSYHNHHNETKKHEQDKMKDPHYWLSPNNIKILIPVIENELISTFPNQEKEFKKNARKYMSEIDKLDRRITEELNNCESRKYIAYHPAWQYFSRDYELEMVGVILKKPGQEPSPGELAELIDLVKENNIRVIFGEKQAPKNIPNIIVNETDAKLLDLDPIGGTPELNSYIKLMNHNFNLIKEGLCE